MERERRGLGVAVTVWAAATAAACAWLGREAWAHGFETGLGWLLIFGPVVGGLVAIAVLTVVTGLRWRGRRREGRRRRGECVKCGYSRRGLAEGARCPECGEGPL